MAILHDELNPRIFDEKGNMRENIREALLKIVQEFLNKLNQNEIPISVVDYRLVGSNAAYNYSPKSDMDIHIIADLSIFRENEKLLQLLYDYFKSNFNDKYDIKVKGMEVELYIEDASKGSISNGVYSIKEDEWVKKPKHTTILDIDITKSQQYQDLYKQYQELKDDEVNDFIDNLYVIRKVSLSKNGEFGDGNLIFKAFRDNGYLDDLRTRQAEIKSRELSLESLTEDLVDEVSNAGVIFKIVDTENVSDDLTYLYIKVGIKGDTNYLAGSLMIEYNDNTSEFIVDTHRQCNKALLTRIKLVLDLSDDEIIDLLREFIHDKEKSIGRFNDAHKMLGETIREAVSPQGYSPKKTGKAYKVFKVKNGKLYPPMVANSGGKDTPVGVWLDAEEGEFAGLSKTGRPKVKSTGGEPLAYRPGWHLGDIPRAKQFDRLNKETGEYEFPKDFVWAECDYAMDVDYQPESDAQGYMRTKRDDNGNVVTYKSDKYQHSLAGLPKLPKDGYYKYRTNPNPDTVPWVITGQMKVNRLLSDDEVNAILKKNGIAPIHRQGGDKSLKELGLNESLNEDADSSIQYDSEGNQLTKAQAEFFKNSKIRDNKGRLLVVYHGTDAEFDTFSKSLFKFGHWFTEDKEYAKGFGSIIKSMYLKSKKPLNLENSKDERVFWKVVKNILGKEDVSETEIWNSVDVYNSIRELGYDAIMFEHSGYYTIVVFDENQIKDITNKTPTNSNNINESLKLNEVSVVDKIPLSQEQDRRVKLTTEDKEEIRRLYATGFHSLNSLAKQFGVSKKLILITVNPESKAKNDERIKNHWRDYYDTQEHTSAMRDTRAYKKDLLDKGELKKVDESVIFGEYTKAKDTKYKKIQSKPINTLTVEDICYIYFVEDKVPLLPYTNVSYDDNMDDLWNDTVDSMIDSEDVISCYEYLHKLTFPLTIYRGIRSGGYSSDEMRGEYGDIDSLDISGKNNSRSWTTNINIYKAKNSMFKNLTNIVACEVNSDVIDNATTVSCYIHYTSRPQYGMFGEYEITLKKNFKKSDLHNLRFVDKTTINEATLKEVYPNKGESKKDFISRFMSVTKDEYPDVKQRYAVANSYWDRRNKK